MNNENETNKSIVTSYRLKEDTKENIKRQLDQLGLTQEQYFNKVVTLMELENVKQNNIFAVNTEELKTLTDRIYNIFIGLCEQGNSFLSTKDIELEELNAKYKDIIVTKEDKFTKVNNELQRVYGELDVIQLENDNNKNDLMNIKAEHNKQLEQLESNLKDKTLIVEEYKQKNDMLLSNLAEYKQYREQYKELQEQLTQLKSDNSTKENTINSLENNNKQLQDKINNDAEMLDFYKSNNAELKANIKALEDKYNKQIQEVKAEAIKVLDERIKANKQEIINKEVELNNKHDIEVAKKDLEIQKLNNTIEQLKSKDHKPGTTTNIKSK